MVNAHDRRILHELAKQVADIADLPVMEERRGMWERHNRLERVRPMILVFPEGSWQELLPHSVLECEEQPARNMEWSLRSRIYHHEYLHDDTVIEKQWLVHRSVHNSGWGLQPKHRPSTEARGAWAFDPVLKDRDDLAKLSWPTIEVDPDATERNLSAAQELFGDILDVQLRGVNRVSFHLMSQYCHLRGLEQAMIDMVDDPELLHDTMVFFEEGHRRLVQQYINQNLLNINNDSTYHSSGGVGYSTELPLPDHDPDHIRPSDMWASAEAQELAEVSPAMHAEFSLQYEKRLMEPFGLNGYGCCEDLTHKLDDVFTIPNIRRISISPFADVDRCAEKIQGNYIFSWKPHPSHLVGDFDETKVRSYIQHTLDVTRDGVVEMILKDTHTCEHHPERFTQWTDIAQELVSQY